MIALHELEWFDAVNPGSTRRNNPSNQSSTKNSSNLIQPVRGDCDELRDAKGHYIAKEPEHDCHYVFSGDK